MAQFSNMQELVIKACTEGVYQDNSLNRKLGKVGMFYKQYQDKLLKNKEILYQEIDLNQLKKFRNF